jgi:hypothetical protein
MTSRERVKKAILFQKPDRVPVDLPEPWGSDFKTVSPALNPAFKPKVEGEDEWGCIWEKLPDDKTMGQVKIHPLKDYSMLDNFKFPNYDSAAIYEHIKEVVAKNKLSQQKFIIAGIPFSLIHRLEYLRGHEQAWTDPYLYPDKLDKLLDRFTDIAVDSVKHLSELGVDGIISCDDWGLQDRLLLRPEIFRKFFKPKYARVYKFARKCGLFTFLHSCGYITEILDDLIEADLQVIQMDQQENMGIDNLSNKFGGRICFWCPVDIQNTMIKGTTENVRDYAKKLIDSFGKFNGGFIGKWYPSPEAVGHTREKINIMSKTFIDHGKYY